MRACLECGKEIIVKRRYARTTSFCGGACRRVFNNRRATRGAVLYDLTMIIRNAPGTNLHAAEHRLEKLIASWEFEDGERRRWKPARLVFEDTAYLTAEAVRVR